MDGFDKEFTSEKLNYEGDKEPNPKEVDKYNKVFEDFWADPSIYSI